MHWDDDPLTYWLCCPPRTRGTRDSDARRAAGALQEQLERLEAHLDPPRGTRRKGSFRLLIPPHALLGPDDLDRLRTLYLRAVEVGGAGGTAIQSALLDLIGRSALPASVPFWTELLELRRPRDRFAGKRRVLALAALAYLVAEEEDASSLNALMEATRHDEPQVRAEAVRHLVAAFRESERPFPAVVIDRLQAVATEPGALVARVVARTTLSALDLPVPVANPNGAYVFKVVYQRDRRVQLVVEVGAEQTLADLHRVIQNGLDWDDDHLYAFYINGPHDEELTFGRRFEEGDPPFAAQAVLGELGLRPGDRFDYLFDFGDNHAFDVEVKEVKEAPAAGRLPRVVELSCDPPEQYPGW